RNGPPLVTGANGLVKRQLAIEARGTPIDVVIGRGAKKAGVVERPRPPAVVYATGTGSRPQGIVQADFNTDGRPDIAVTVAVQLNTTYLATVAAGSLGQLTLAPNPATIRATMVATSLPATVHSLEAALYSPTGQAVCRVAAQRAARQREVDNALIVQALCERKPSPNALAQLKRYVTGELSREHAFAELYTGMGEVAPKGIAVVVAQARGGRGGIEEAIGAGAAQVGTSAQPAPAGAQAREHQVGPAREHEGRIAAKRRHGRPALEHAAEGGGGGRIISRGGGAQQQQFAAPVHQQAMRKIQPAAAQIRGPGPRRRPGRVGVKFHDGHVDITAKSGLVRAGGRRVAGLKHHARRLGLVFGELARAGGYQQAAGGRVKAQAVGALVAQLGPRRVGASG
nr:hypothetical protein [Tanacetum cinerariifolium]